MRVITGDSGRVGSATARKFFAAGAEVRVLVRRGADAEACEHRTAEARTVAIAISRLLAA
ncbi:MAG: hypothetical protein ACK5LO_14525 [Leucobacter sp.]